MGKTLTLRGSAVPDVLALAKAVPQGRQAPHFLPAVVPYLLDRDGVNRVHAVSR